MDGSMGRAPLRRVLALVATALLAGTLMLGVAHAGGPGKWTKLPTTGKPDGFDEPGLLRTPDGKLHVVWKVHIGTKYNLRWATISQAGKVLASGTVLSPNWTSIAPTPELMPFGSKGVRVVFQGDLDTSANFFSTGSAYTATSPDGQHWTLEHVSLANHNVLNGGFSATAEPNGTPVAAFGLNSTLYFHEGTDPSAPAGSADGSVTQAAFGLEQESLTTDSDGSVWLAWYRYSDAATQGIWVEKILPSQGSPQKAPGSGIAAQSSDPRQQVAIVGRKGGGVFVAYCAPTKTKQCAKIELWKVGAGKAKIVPGSTTGSVAHATIAAGLQGRISVAWMDVTKNVIHAVRTNTTGAAFGPLRTVKAPPKSFVYDTLEAEGSSGRLDIVANIISSANGFPVQLWHTQILPGLSLKASPHTFSHTGATVTFTVTDAGQPLANAGVSCLGHKGKTNANGKVTIHFPGGTPKGNAVATASKGGYNSAKITIKVT
jgi:hypothetical protein